MTSSIGETVTLAQLETDPYPVLQQLRAHEPVSWVPDMGELFARHANLKTLYDRVASVPAVAKVWARNGV